ncbi:MAG: EAL domain-containing protein [Burkholderiaceae bacterium]|nr:EAL domain-containing protein [Burkholderiaceae bacterium]
MSEARPETRCHRRSADDAQPDWQLLPSPVLVLTTAGDATAVNCAFNDLTGLAAEAACGAGWRSVLGAEALAPLHEALAARRDFRLQLALRRVGSAAAAETWVDCSARWLPLAERYLCQLHDVSAVRMAEAGAREQAQQLRLVANSVPALMALYAADDYRCLFANAGYAKTFGHTEQSILGQTFEQIIGADAARMVKPFVDEVHRHGRPTRYERQLTTPQGRQWIDVQMVPHLAEDGKVLAAFVLITDITRHREAERTVRESEERLGKFMQASVEGIVFHKDGIVTDANPPILALMGYTLDEIVGRKNLEFIAPEQVPKVLEVMASGAETTYESVLLHKDGLRIPVEFIVRTIERGGEKLRMTIVRDLRDREAARSHIYHLAHHDALTGLLNRMAFMERLEVLMGSGRSGDAEGALLFIDLDQFKRVNDSLGHLAGDVLLQTLAQRLKQLLRGSDLVARFGGDEFLVLLPGALPLADVQEVARKVLVSFAAPLLLEGRSISVTPSVGIALYPLHAGTPAELIRCADAAMYAAKQQGRATQRCYDPELGQRALAALELESQLTQAVTRGEFVLHYQPQVRAGDGVLVGAEALIRWRHPTRGLVEPDDFIPLVEQHRLVMPIGQWVLREAVRAARRWQSAGRALSVSVNVSSLQFRDAGFGASVAQVLREEGLAGEWLELEITERMLMEDIDAVSATLADLKALGVRIAIDDFGTGYSSLGRLNRLPIDRIKIDRSFVQGLPDNTGHAAIARAIVMLAQSLGLATIAEGVETEAQRDFLVALGCEQLQGQLFGAPRADDRFAATVA